MKKIILSENKMNQLISGISDELMSGFPFSDGVIRGEELLKFSNRKQVNNFILFQIYQDWNGHAAKFVHPWFDFERKEVREALQRFMNIASRYICVEKDDFRPLVEKAVFNSLRLILNPGEAFQKFFFLNADSIPVAVYKKHAPYFADFDFVIQAILKYLEKNQLQVLDKDLFYEKFNRVIELFEQKEGKEIQKYQALLFYRLTGRQLVDILRAEAAAPESKMPSSRFSRKPGNQGGYTTSREADTSRLSGSENKANTPPPVTPPESKEPPKAEKQDFYSQPQVQTPPPAAEPEKHEDVSSPRIEPEVSESPTVQPPITPPVREEQPVAEKQTPAQEPQSESSGEEKPKTLSERLAESAEKKPALHEMLSGNKEKSVFERSMEKQEEADNIVSKEVHSTVSEAPQNDITSTEVPAEEISEEESTDNPLQEESGQEEMEAITPDREASWEEEEKPTPLGRAIDLFSPMDEEEEGISFGKKEGKTVMDSFREKSSGSVNDSLGKARSIELEQIPVHKQFQFVQKLFGGSSVKFKVVLDKVNETASPSEAKDLVQKYVFSNPDVNPDTKIAQEFRDLVSRRFG